MRFSPTGERRDFEKLQRERENCKVQPMYARTSYMMLLLLLLLMHAEEKKKEEG